MKYEHKIVTFPAEPESNLEKYLNEMSEQGWNLAHCHVEQIDLTEHEFETDPVEGIVLKRKAKIETTASGAPKYLVSKKCYKIIFKRSLVTVDRLGVDYSPEIWNKTIAQGIKHVNISDNDLNVDANNDKGVIKESSDPSSDQPDLNLLSGEMGSAPVSSKHDSSSDEKISVIAEPVIEAKDAEMTSITEELSRPESYWHGVRSKAICGDGFDLPISITFIMPCYGRQFETERLLECMQKQTVNNFQVIAIGDGCEDFQSHMEQYRQIGLKQFQHGNLFDFIDLENHSGGFGFACRNWVKNHSPMIKGRYVAFLDNDDVVDTNHVANYMTGVMDDKMDIIAYDTWVKGEDGEWRLRRAEGTRGKVGHAEMVIKRTVFCNLKDQSDKYGHDWEWFQMISPFTPRVAYIHNPPTYRILKVKQ